MFIFTKVHIPWYFCHIFRTAMTWLGSYEMLHSQHAFFGALNNVSFKGFPSDFATSAIPLSRYYGQLSR